MVISIGWLCKNHFFLDGAFEGEDFGAEDSLGRDFEVQRFEAEDLPDDGAGRGLVSFRGFGLSMSRPWFMAETAPHTFLYMRLAERYFLMYK